MCDITFVSRASDGLLLAETWDDATANPQLHALKQQAKQVLKRIAHGPNRCSVDAGAYKYHYLVEDGVAFMTVCGASYPKKLAFSFLDDIQRAFQEELQTSFGTHAVDYRSIIETIEKPYYFVKFDRVIQRKKQDYRDPDSSRALNKLNQSLTEVTGIMRRNIEDILQRGENLEDVGRKAGDLKDASAKFKGLAKALSFRALLQQYAPLLVMCLFFLILIFWRFFL
ncbi:putative vesicle trafficking protein [Neospora caninum Liverpool]|uniref:Putative vesicle trafficking protein n=1 Tax=Neospora caninum (strain Liverpool) TaxID=572307 RepID=F0VJG1_NEOCL|nr:putative vesicle trafficking protein [Neospora caninum Liverpool]CBZ53872.1 putative vesicle trafficking protein [Neospora caninum Liverpool]CEL67867.1 TPA: vesicle trafficking protein, putative [Neospora caninum Liverpool]|eukprot:XP_003883904.1 putative vesicle trafficking protein [Neospora caninum Liverpool]